MNRILILALSVWLTLFVGLGTLKATLTTIGTAGYDSVGSGVIEGIECDYFAFRNEKVDWQIWIAHGPNPYPVRYIITSKDMPHSPQYTIQIRDWKTGSDVASDNFVFENSTNATKVDVEDLEGMSPLPDHFEGGDVK